MRTKEATITAQVTPKVVGAIRETIELLIDIRGHEVTRFEPVKSVVAWLETAEREGANNAGA